MIFKETVLHGAFVLELEPFRDHRGQFARTFCKREFVAQGLQSDFVQFNHSWNRQQGTLRGLHFQYPPHSEAKLIRCIRGAVVDVIVDLRQGSYSFLKYVMVVLSADNQKMIYIPEGFAHGFQTLEANTELLYHHTAYYQPGAEGGLKFDDPTLAISWPLTPESLSEKDKSYEYLKPEFQGVKV